MGKYSIVVEKAAQKELQSHHKSGDKASIKKIDKIFEELAEHPQTGTGQPEQLKFGLVGYWSRQINKKDRLIYRIEDKVITVFVVSAIGHYGDK
ncbi:Txe/YoeB family addiction module toxin [bacterium]|nr:MAG: Txe/YoeB family addiction module toxin [bacterium]